MDVRLGQLEAHKSMLAYQEKHQMYVPETKEEFLSYGRLESQEPNQNTQPMIDFLVEKIGDDYSQAMMEFYFLQEMLRDNYSNKEIADIILSGKKREKLPEEKSGKGNPAYAQTYQNMAGFGLYPGRNRKGGKPETVKGRKCNGQPGLEPGASFTEG